MPNWEGGWRINWCRYCSGQVKPYIFIEPFSKIRHLSRNVKALSEVKDKEEQKNLMQKSGEIIAEVLDNDLDVTDSETSIEINFALLKFKHTVKKKK